MFDLASSDLSSWVPALAELGREVTDAERIDRIRQLEELKSAASAAQARASADLDASQRGAQAAAGVPARRQGEGIASQVGLARRESPTKGARYLGLAKILTREMPRTLALMTGVC